ncbi:MAG: hypothetical protein R2778_12365 [Saprospiraceae bacterium]
MDSIQWRGNIVSGDNTLIPNIDALSTYTLTATDLNNGCGMTLDAIVLQDINTPSLQIANHSNYLQQVIRRETLQWSNLSLPGNFLLQLGGQQRWQYCIWNKWSESGSGCRGDYTFTSFNLDNGCSSNILVSGPKHHTTNGGCRIE